MQKNSIIKGTLILTVASLITRIMGFFHRVYMSSAIGSEGMGLYQLVMPIYFLTWTITSSGFSTAVSKITAKENAVGKYGNIEKSVKVTVLLCITISLALSSVLFFGADCIASEIVKDTRTAVSFKILAFTMPFMAMGSCLRGYFLGMQKQLIPAISQVLEQTVRIMVIAILAPIFSSMGLEYACAAAIIGVFLGEAVSCIFTVISYHGFNNFKYYKSHSDMTATACITAILAMSVPLTASRVSAALLSAYENILIPQKLQEFGESAESAMSTFGNLTGMAIPLIQLPNALFFAVSTVILPMITEENVKGNIQKIKTAVNDVTGLAVITGIGISAVFAAFPNEISFTVYSNMETGEFISKLVPICPFLYLHIILVGILNGLGKHNFVFKTGILCSLISILFIVFFMPIYGYEAYIFGWLASLVLSDLISIFKVFKITGAFPNIYKSVVCPVISALGAEIISKFILKFLSPSKTVYILAIILMIIIYMIFLFVTGTLNKKDLDFLRE